MGRCMFGKLEFIRDWESRARRAGYDVSKLALICGVSERRLQQFFHERRGFCPHRWLICLRLSDGMMALPERITVKETSIQLGFREPTKFCRMFKQAFGCPPGDFLRQKRSRASRISFFGHFISFFGHSVSENGHQFCSIRTEEDASNIAEISPSSYESAAIPDFSGRHYHTPGPTNQTASRLPRRA